MRTWGEIDERLDPLFYLNMLLLNKNIVHKSKHSVSTFKQKVNMQRGRFGHRPRNDPRYYGGKYPFIQTGNVVKASEANERIKYTQTLNDLGLSTSRLFDERVLVITIAANIGYTAILDYNACFPDSLVALTTKGNDLSLDYLNVYIRFIRNYIENLAPQAAQKNINLKQLSKLPILVPDRDIQKRIVEIMNEAYTEKIAKEKEAQALLDSINDYLLHELSIVMPEENENTLENRMFYIKSPNILGGRFDPRKHSAKFKKIFDAVEYSSIPKVQLKKVIVDSVSGNWGLEDNGSDDSLIKCLTIRATEFDNRYNLKLDNSRVKYRMFPKHIFNRIELKRNDILIEKSGGSEDQPVGRVAIIDDSVLNSIETPLAFSNFIHKIQINEDLAYSQYIFEFLTLIHSIKITEAMQTQTNGIRNLIMSEYFNQIILLPPIPIQKTIVERIIAIRNQAKSLELEAMNTLEKSQKEVQKMLLGGETL